MVSNIPNGCLTWNENFLLVMLPAAKLKDLDFKVTPKRMGAVLGHMCEMSVWVMEWCNNQAELLTKRQGIH